MLIFRWMLYGNRVTRAEINQYLLHGVTPTFFQPFLNISLSNLNFHHHFNLMSSWVVDRVHEAHIFLLQRGRRNANWSVQLTCDTTIPFLGLTVLPVLSPSSYVGRGYLVQLRIMRKLKPILGSLDLKLLCMIEWSYFSVSLYQGELFLTWNEKIGSLVLCLNKTITFRAAKEGNKDERYSPHSSVYLWYIKTVILAYGC